MQLDNEISHLLDLMPASGRMLTKIIGRTGQSRLIEAPIPKPWNKGGYPIYINFDLWKRLSRPERDLLFLRAVTFLISIQWFKPAFEQTLVVGSLFGLIVEASQQDVVGVAISAGLGILASQRIWRNYRSSERELEIDESAIKTATKRGYSQIKAAKSLLDALENSAQIENRPLKFSELLRCQNLKSLCTSNSKESWEKIN